MGYCAHNCIHNQGISYWKNISTEVSTMYCCRLVAIYMKNCNLETQQAATRQNVMDHVERTDQETIPKWWSVLSTRPNVIINLIKII